MDTILVPTAAELSVVGRAVSRAANRSRVVVSRLGVGPEASARYTHHAGASPGDRLALVGWGGGLRPDLVAGATVVASACLDGEGRSVGCEVLALRGALTGPTLTVSSPLLTVSAKTRAGIESGALAVEMEAFPLALWAAERGVRFYHVRVILDALGEPLPDLDALLDQSGSLTRGWLRRLLARPSAIPGVVRLARRTREVSPALSEAAYSICAAWQRSGPA